MESTSRHLRQECATSGGNGNGASGNGLIDDATDGHRDRPENSADNRECESQASCSQRSRNEMSEGAEGSQSMGQSRKRSPYHIDDAEGSLRDRQSRERSLRHVTDAEGSLRQRQSRKRSLQNVVDSSGTSSEEPIRKHRRGSKPSQSRSISRSLILESHPMTFRRSSRNQTRSNGSGQRHRRRYARSRNRSTKRRSRSISRASSRSNVFSSADERLSRKQRRKVYYRRSSSNSVEGEMNRREYDRRRSRLLSPSINRNNRRRHALSRSGKRQRYDRDSDDDEPHNSDKLRRVPYSSKEHPQLHGELRTHVKRSQKADNDKTNIILNKFLNILKDVKGPSTSKLSLSNVVPEFDPMIKDQTILTWLTKVEECAEIYGWDERETIHFALPKLTGIAKSWYQGLDTVLYTWGEWKKKLLESFPCRDDYAELLTTMLAKKVRYGDSFEKYFYEKINLLNRCGIKGRKAVDCILNGIEDRAIRVGAQAAQFREPEEVLKYLKTVKVGTSRDPNDRKDRQEKRPFVKGIFNNKKINPPKRIICHNCNEEGHKSFECSKPLVNCSVCNRTGHLNTYCRSNKNIIQDRNRNTKDFTTKDEKQVSELFASGESNKKYVFDVMINQTKLLCHIDLGSQCTLIRETEAKRLNLKFDDVGLPLMRGIGGHHIKPLGKCMADVTVQGIKENIEIFVVQDSVLQYPVLLGHSFTEKPHITITKTSNEIIFEKSKTNKLFMRIQDDVTLPPNEISIVTVNSHVNFTGQIYIHGSVRGNVNQEYYLLPGDYTVKVGIGRVLLMNMTEMDITLKRETLITRAVPIIDSLDVSVVSFDQTHSDDTVQCGPQMTEKQRSQLNELLTKFSDCFSSGLKDLGVTTAGELEIQLDNVEPVVYRPYRMSHTERTLVRDMVGEMLDAGIVRESSSPYASPIVLVKKKTGEKRLCVDYRALNRRTKKDHYPLPRVEDQLDRLAGNNLFISLDLASGYYQIPISEASQDKTAFVTPDGQYEYTRMPFGLVNAPSVFQRTMNKILMEAKIKYALVYMDDILIPARTFEEGMERLEEVITLLREGGLTLKLSKCHFFFDHIDFLGFEVSSEGIKPGMRKTEAVAKFPVPKNQHELRQFIGLASFFRRFVRGFAVIARPLTDLLSKNVEWKWGTEQMDAFRALKESLTCRPILALYDPNRETQLHTDASKYGVAGILLQKCDDGNLKPVSYFSRKTTPDEQKLHSYDLETLAVVASLSRFRVYLLGVPFKIYTDCNALRTSLTKRDLVPRIARWWVQLQEFDCEIEYRPGNRMAHADALSRNPVNEAQVEEHILDVLSLNEEDWIVTVQSSDDEISRIKQILGDPESEKVADIIKNYKLKNGKVYRLVGGEGENMRWVVPKGVRWQVAKMNHDDIGHFGFEKTLTRIQQSFWFPKMRRFVKKYVRSCLECAHCKGTTGKQQGELHPIPRVEVPFHTIHADHLGPFVRSTKGNTYLLVIIDGFTKFINITAVRNTKTVTTLRVLRDHISYFGAPTRLITDQGTSFTSNSFRAFMKTLGIKHVLNAVATPRANGQVERFNRTILEALSAKCHGKDDKRWDEFVPDIQIGLNTTVHKTTGKSPSEVLFGCRLKGSTENILSEVINETLDAADTENLNSIRSVVGQRIRDQQVKDKESFDAKRKVNQSFEAGDLVSIRREMPNNDGKSKKLLMKYQGPYRLVKILPNDRYLVEDTPLTRKNGKRYENIVSIDKIKPWLSFNKNFDSSSSSESENADKDD